MSLISQINEAAGVPLADLKAAVKKDKRVSKIFTKDLQLDQIDNVKEFIQTLRFYILNNRNVIEFVKSRNGASSRVNNWSLKALRQIRPEGLNQDSLEELQKEVADLFKDITSTGNATYSNGTAESLWGWLQRMKGFRGALNYHAVRELKTLPAIRPEKPIVVYRGLLFNEQSLKERDDYNGGMAVGDGLKFLRAQREGKRVVDLTYEEPTAWFRNKEQALDEAHNGDEAWRSERKAIKGELAFVVSMIVDPKHIIVDTSMMPKVTHDKPTVVVDAGKYTVRIVHKFTPTGEVDPVEVASDSSEGASVLENLQTFAHVFKLPYVDPVFEDLTRGGWDADRVASFIQLAKPDTKVRINKAMQNLIDYYNEYLKNIPKNELNDLSGHKQLGVAAQVAKEIDDIMSEKTAHPTERDTRYSGFRQLHKPRHELTADEMWEGHKSSSLRGSIPTLKMSATTPRFRDWSTWSPIISLMHMSGVPVTKDLHQKGAKVQREEVLKTIDAFFHTIGEAKPEGQENAVNRMHEVILTAERNASILSKLWAVRHLLDKLKD
jgi:hypothetical protein